MNAHDDLSFKDSLTIHIEELAGVAVETAKNLYHGLASITENCLPANAFTPLQLILLKVVFVLILGTLGLIVCSWRVYGHVITEKFVRPSTLKEIEELKLSVAKLKLPKEHSPRI